MKLYIQKKSFQNEAEILVSNKKKVKDFIIRSVCYVRGSSREGRSKLMSDKKMNLHKEMNSNRNVYIQVNIKICFSFLISAADHRLFKAKITAVYCEIYNT